MKEKAFDIGAGQKGGENTDVASLTPEEIAKRKNMALVWKIMPNSNEMPAVNKHPGNRPKHGEVLRYDKYNRKNVLQM